MKSLAQLCKPRQSVFDHNRRDVVLDLTDLAEGHIDPGEFFAENYFTVGMRHLLREAFRRFAGQSPQGVFVLTQAITGQRLGIGIGRRQAQLLQLVGGFGVCPAMLVGLGQATPPDLVPKAQRPRRLGMGPLDQPVAPFFSRAYAGSGLVIQCLARFHDTRKRRSATRIAALLTSRGVSPWAKLTSAASARVHRLGGLPNVRGLWCNSARRDSQTPGVKIVARVWGRDDCGCSAARPRWWNACSALRTV